MKLSLSDNIRSLRKQRKMTQEKLAEALGVTVGAVYKWESGQSLPELNMVVEMADFFDTSVDVLLGYRMKDNSLDSAIERINHYCKTLDPAALTEAEKMIGKYPHSFMSVLSCASVYLAFGAANHDPNHLRRSLELFERSKMLLSQNDDPKVSEAMICGNMALTNFLLGNTEKSLELLKQNNVNGTFNSYIGTILSIYTNTPEEAADYLSEALAESVSTLFTVISGFVFVFRSRGDFTSALDILHWGIRLLEGIKMSSEQDALEKSHAELLVLLAYAEERSGMEAEAAASLRKARSMALHFDSLPDYSLRTQRFVEHPEQSVVFDVLGATASESIAELIRLLGSEYLATQWRELAENE